MPSRQDVDGILAERREYDGELANASSSTSQDRAFKTLLVILAILVLFPLVTLSGYNFNYVLHLLLYAFMYIAMASSWNILGGFAGYISIGHNVFFAIGGYFSGMLLAKFGISTLLTAPLAGLLALAVGFAVGFITLRVRGPSFIISSIALLMVTRIVFDNWDFIGGSNGITLPQMELPVRFVKVPFYYGMLTLAVITLVVSYFIRHSKFGLGLRALSQDEIKAECAGINTRLYKIMAFAISGFFVGAAGAMWGEYLTYIRPNIFLVILVAANMVLMCILGGKGTVAGPTVGAILLIAFNEFFVSQFGASQINILGTGVVMLLALMFYPNGVVGTLEKKGKLPRILNWG